MLKIDRSKCSSFTAITFQSIDLTSQSIIFSIKVSCFQNLKVSLYYEIPIIDRVVPVGNKGQMLRLDVPLEFVCWWQISFLLEIRILVGMIMLINVLALLMDLYHLPKVGASHRLIIW